MKILPFHRSHQLAAAFATSKLLLNDKNTIFLSKSTDIRFDYQDVQNHDCLPSAANK